VTGRERLSWHQAAPGAAIVSQYRYAVYVDNSRTPLDAVCSSQVDSSEGYLCSSPLPPLTRGRHVLEVVSILEFESARSAPLVVNMIGSSSSSAVTTRSMPAIGAVVSRDGAYRVDIVAGDLHSPMALASTPDNRLIVGERSGRVVILDPASRSARVALAPEELDDDSVVVHDIVLHPQYGENHFVFVLFTAVHQAGAVMRVTRFREVDGTLGEPASVAESLPSARAEPSGALTLDRYGKLYIAIGADAEISASDPTTLMGVVVQLNDDGTMPRESGTFLRGIGPAGWQPVGLDWNPTDGSLWVVARRDPGGNVRADAKEPQSHVLVRSAAAAARVYRGAAIPPFTGCLLIATLEDEQLERWSFDSAARTWRLRETLFRGRFGRLASIAEGADGFVYVGTGNSSPTSSVGSDVIFRLRRARPAAANR
jgi:glucose/arabinose dehydrogenase